MFVARDSKGNLVNALEKEVTKQAYTCPACGGGLRLRQGQSMRTHFAHESLRDCMAIFENESPEHLANKEALYHWAKKDNQAAEVKLFDFVIGGLVRENRFHCI